MILTCPNCGTQYVVKDGAIPPEGRQVRCAACKHSWHQDPDKAVAGEAGAPPVASEETAVAAESQPAPIDEQADPGEDRSSEESLTEATLIEPRSGPEAEERAYEESVIEPGPAVQAGSSATPDETGLNPPADQVAQSADWDAPPQVEEASDDFSPFVAGDFEEERRRSPLATILIVVLVILVLAAALWFFAPLSLKARLGLAAAGASPLALVVTHRDRQPLESGQELLTVTGRVINPTAAEQEVPPLQAQLLGHGGKVIYSWTIAPPARSLPAGGAAGFNSAEVNVPPGGQDVRITLGSPKA